MSPLSEDARLRAAIRRADAILPGRPAPDGKRDPRWQAINRVANFIETDPVPVCEFALRWARRPGIDLGRALYCCLFEELLAHRFDVAWPMIRKASFANRRVAHFFDHYSPYFLFGQAQLPRNILRMKRLARELRKFYGES